MVVILVVWVAVWALGVSWHIDLEWEVVGDLVDEGLEQRALEAALWQMELARSRLGRAPSVLAQPDWEELPSILVRG